MTLCTQNLFTHFFLLHMFQIVVCGYVPFVWIFWYHLLIKSFIYNPDVKRYKGHFCKLHCSNNCIRLWYSPRVFMVLSLSENFPLISFILSFNVLQDHLEKFCLNAHTFQFLSKIPSRWGAFVSTSDFWNMYGWSSKNVPMQNLISVKFILVPISSSSICWMIFGF